VRAALFAVLLVGCAEGSGDTVEPASDASVDSARDTAPAPETGPSCDPAADPCPPEQHCSPILRQCIPGCHADSGCMKGKCDVPNHECVDCLANPDCLADEVCSGGKCVPGCTPERPCPGSLTCCAGGCIDPSNSIDHCGGCGTKCTVTNGSPACTAGKCAIASCKTPWENCDGNAANGCETDTTASRDHCGGCGKPCNPKNGTGTCALGVCKVSMCNAGFGDCNGNPADGCEANFASDPANCGSCGGKPVETCNLRDDNCNGACDDIDGCRKAIHRSASSSDHFYTDSATEAGCCGYSVVALNYFYLYASSAPDTTAFYRCYNGAEGRHFYTTSSTCEIWGAGAVEGVIGFIGTKETCGAVPLYRLWIGTRGHVFTTDPAERASLMSAGYKDEGPTGYVWKSPRG
jgi:hypothetical protein